MQNKHNYDEENWQSLIQGEIASQENLSPIKAITKNIFHKDNKDLLSDIYGGAGPNLFGGYGVVTHADIVETTNLLDERVELVDLTLEISDIFSGQSTEYHIDCPIEINDGEGSQFLELLERLQEDEKCASTELKQLSGHLINHKVNLIEERVELVSPEKRAHLLPLFCQAIIDLQVFVKGTIAYSCQDQQQHFFIKNLKIKNWLHDESEGECEDDCN